MARINVESIRDCRNEHIRVSIRGHSLRIRRTEKEIVPEKTKRFYSNCYGMFSSLVLLLTVFAECTFSSKKMREEVEKTA